MSGPKCIAVALHDVEPATFTRCALIRDWLSDHDVDRVTMLVTPAPDLHHFDDRSPELATWLASCLASGDAIAQHGFHHGSSRAERGRDLGARRVDAHAAEFAGLTERETRRAVSAGRRVLKLAGIEPRGFVAPGYHYTDALCRALAGRFDWWAGSRGLECADRGEIRARAMRLDGGGWLSRAVGPARLRWSAVRCGPTLRLDIHPHDLDDPRHMLALEGVLRRVGNTRRAVTYDELVAVGESNPGPRPVAAGQG